MRATIRMTRMTEGDELELAVDGTHVALARRYAGRTTSALAVDAHPTSEAAREAYRAQVIRALERGYLPVRAARPT